MRALRPTVNRFAPLRTRFRTMTAKASLSYPAPLEITPSDAHNSTVVVLHGLGDTGYGWANVAGSFSKDLKNTKFLFPTAPMRPITLNMGMRMTGWYDMNSLDSLDLEEDAEGLLESQRYIEGLIAQEVMQGINAEKIIVAGFSQGGAVALMMLRSDVKLAGIIGLSTYVPLREVPPIVSEANKQTPVLMCHGSMDPVIMYEYGKSSADALAALGTTVDFKTYPGMGHSACDEEFKHMLDFIKSCLS